jgi:phage tail protein X
MITLLLCLILADIVMPIDCGLEIPTDPSPSLFEAKSAVVASCSGGQTYVTQHGDTCDSIALNKSISAATLYYINPGLTNCNNIEDGLELCLPPSCAVTHTVKEDEDCVALALEWGASWTSLIDWNLGIDSRCLNLWSTNPFWGRVICVSPPGGQYKIPKKMKHMTTGDGNTGSHRYFKDSNSYESFRFDSQPPGETAQGTTDKCGEYIQAKSGVGCSRMLVDTTTAIPIDLFLQANPSLGTALECDKKLVPSLWYCLRPLRSRMSSI